MATSAIGPGFLTQTSAFTEELFTSFGFVILISILLDLGAQLNVWRIVTMSESRAQDLSNKLFPGLGVVLASLIAFGGLVFNIGNIAGCGLGINVLTTLSPKTGAVISCIISLGIFWYREAGKAMDVAVKILGLLMIGLTAYVAITSHPPLAQALYRTVWPEKMDVMKIVTLVGGTVGGYISFAGAHRLLDAGIKGKQNLRQVTQSSVSGIVITSIMRYVLFLAALGVVAHHMPLSPANPAATVFLSAAGQIGYKFFGVVLWCAAITSVVGASFTTVSFWKTLVPAINRNEKTYISLFIVFSTIIFVGVGQPVKLLIFAGAVNGIILPLALGIVLIASHRSSLMHGYRHSLLLQVIGWVVVAAMSWMGWLTIEQNFAKFF